jgi:AbrB family looped-hinge helix DNA binding protein
MNVTTVNAKGQVTIPGALRSKYGFPPGTKVVWVERDGDLIPRPLLSVASLYGYWSTKPGEKPLTEALLEERKAERAREQ